MCELGWTYPAERAFAGRARGGGAGQEADVAVVLARVFESEQRDRASLDPAQRPGPADRGRGRCQPAHRRGAGCGGPVTMPWLDQVPAIVNAYYGGQEQGAAIADVLFGDVNPSGKLPITFPRSEAQVPVPNPVQRPQEQDAVHTEGIFVGYRAYDHDGRDPLFPFGHGLSYTTFAYNNLRLSAEAMALGEQLEVSVDVTNTGRRAGQEVVQLYIGAAAYGDAAASVARPPKELKDFAKISLAPDESQDGEPHNRGGGVWRSGTSRGMPGRPRRASIEVLDRQLVARPAGAGRAFS